MKLYIIKQTSKDGKEYKRASLRMTNDLTGEEVFLSGFLREFDEDKKWGENGILESYAEISRDKPREKK